MNRKLISKAFNDIEDVYIVEALNLPAAQMDRAPERTIPMNNHTTNKSRIRTRQLLRLAMAACLILALTVTACAVHYYLGIRDMDDKLPETAEPYIQEHTEAAVQEDWSARITESLCDENKVMVTVTVSGGDRYIIAPTDADPDTLAVNIGIEGDQTLGEYAASQGKALLFVGASLKENDALGGNGSQSFQHTNPSEMTILIKANKTGALTEGEIICHVYAVDAEWNKQTMDIPFSLQEAPAESSGLYVPDNANPFPGMTVGNVTVSESPLGISIRFMTSVESQDVFDDIKKVEFDGIVRGEGGGWVLEDDGNWWHTISRCTGEVGDTLVARYYDWDDQLVATITFTKN